MPTLLPFQGILYNPKRIRNIASVVAPPYDVISESEQEAYYRRSPYNIIRLEFGKRFGEDTGADNRYTRARKFFHEWFSEGILRQDPSPAIYVYRHRFPKEGKTAERWGFIALLKLEKGSGSIYPHEHTLAHPKADRLELMKELRANVSPLFFLYPDSQKRIERLLKQTARKEEALWDAALGRERHTLWRINRPELLATFREAFQNRKLFIADGHHRYEVALSFRDQMPSVMAYFSSLSDKSLLILPIHRLIRKLPFGKALFWKRVKAYFAVEEAGTVSAMMAKLKKAKGAYAYGLVFEKRPYLLTLRRGISLSRLTAHLKQTPVWKKLQVTVLHEVMIRRILGFGEEKIQEEISFERHLPSCIRALNQGKYRVGLFLRPSRIEEIRKIALAREKMPQKSTYFYPKPLTGLVFHRPGQNGIGR